MNASTSPLPASDQTLRGILLICAAVFLFASHDGLSKFLSGSTRSSWWSGPATWCTPC